MFKVSRAMAYAVHALSELAAQTSGQPLQSHVIAERRGIPDRFLLKVLKPMTNHGIITSIKGPNGGYRLARKPDTISLYDVLVAVEGEVRAGDTFESTERGGPVTTFLSHVFHAALQHVRKELESAKIADVISQREGAPTNGRRRK